MLAKLSITIINANIYIILYMIVKEGNLSNMSFRVVRRNKIYDKIIKFSNVEYILLPSQYIDRNSNIVYNYDILYTSRIISDPESDIETVNNYFMCYYCEKNKQFDLLYFSYSFMNFIWLDDYVETSDMILLTSGINVLSNAKQVKHIIPEFLHMPIKTMIDKTNLYFHK